jgi:glycosyltransferase involved in cell wall biosynthesis
MKKIIFDVSDLRSFISEFNHLTGIQRVMVMMIDEVAAQTDAKTVWLGYTSDGGRRYIVKPYEQLGDGGMSDLSALATLLDQSAASQPRPLLRRYANKPLKRAYHTALCNINAARGRAAYFEKRGTTIGAWRASAESVAKAKVTPAGFEALEICRPGDWVVMLDAGWTDAGWQGSDNPFKKLREKGVKTAVLVHDLIQIQNPEFIPGRGPLVFYQWLRSTLQTTDFYFANSHATAEDLKGFLQTLDAQHDVHVLPLAQASLKPPPTRQNTCQPSAKLPEIYARLDQTWDLDDNIRALLKWPYVLCVGTMDIRKNLWALAQVWQRLSCRDDITLPKLVFVGRPGSFNEDFNLLMQSTGNLGGWVEIITNAADKELDFLYRHCLFTVMVSFYEGWGLPIGESLSYGKTGVVSNRSSMPEVGRNLVVYCDPFDMKGMQAACLKLITDPVYREELEVRIRNTDLRTWSDVGRDLLEQLASKADINTSARS